ncbi:MAG: type II toxin-antitoxin system RelE/ParE family toxin [Aequoribacter sp.]|uniref:type II toxin-antitoxin system RelE/ParE family toxin n=1 Tax=Aequoribacter sp. TaxID=2847771 RepID=UPI003C459DCD
MKRYRINIRPTAEKDLRQRYEQIHAVSPVNATTWYRSLVEGIRTLEYLALRCSIADESAQLHREVRQLIVGRYRVLYYVHQDLVDVLHIRHVRHARKL